MNAQYIDGKGKQKRRTIVVHGFFFLSQLFYIDTEAERKKDLKDRRMRIRRSKYKKKVYQFEFEV